MRLFRTAVLYTALALGANAALAGPALEALRDGDMRKLVFHADPKPVTTFSFLDEAERGITLQNFKGKYVVLNFWATWCAPCRKEMPSLNALQREFGGERFQVVTLATGRNQPAAIRRFFDDVKIDALPKYRDPKQKIARQMGVLGLPISVILNPEGKEIARLRGDADWASDSARAIVAAMIGSPPTN